MGLDQWLSKEIYIGSEYEHRKMKIIKLDIEKDGKKLELPEENLSKLSYQCMYWRKANQIHKWMVKNIQDGNDDCKDYELYQEAMKELKEICEKALEIQKQILTINPEPELCYKEISKGKVEELEKLLPTSSGFFFGDTSYGEWYFNQIQETYDMLVKELEYVESNPELEVSYMYSSSW